MSKKKQTLQILLDGDELTIVDMYRQGCKVRTGKLPTRSRAIALLITEAGEEFPAAGEEFRLRSYADILALLDSHTERLDSLEGVVRPFDV